MSLGATRYFECGECEHTFATNSVKTWEARTKGDYWDTAQGYVALCPKCGCYAHEITQDIYENTKASNDYFVNVLGVRYTVKWETAKEVAKDMGDESGECGGYCSPLNKTIVLAHYVDDNTISPKEASALINLNMRHEITHAFLFESGLWGNANPTENWAMNEEMVDWIAINGPKLYQAWKEAGAI